MAAVMLVLGILCLGTGTSTVVRRDAIVARHRRRANGAPVQAPAAYLVMGGLLGLTGVLFIAHGLLQMI